MENTLDQFLKIPSERRDDINAVLLNPDTRVVSDFLAVVAKHGTPEEINRKAAQAGAPPVLLKRVEATQPKYLQDLEWLEQQREQGEFISLAGYRRKILGPKADGRQFKDDFAVTLEVSGAQYFPWIVLERQRP